jgi:hypothetical protein
MNDAFLLQFFNRNNLTNTTIIPNNNKCVVDPEGASFRTLLLLLKDISMAHHPRRHLPFRAYAMSPV